MSVHELREIQQAWSGVADILFVPHNQTEYQQLVTTLDRLIDTVGEQESPPLASLMELIGVLIEKYENEHVPEITDL